MSSHSDFQLTLDFLPGKPVVVQPSHAQLSSDAGLLPIRQFDQRLGMTRDFAAALSDSRHPSYTDHAFLEMTRMRVYGILANYPDQNDHDVLRSDPVFKLVCDRSPSEGDLASQPTLSRFENAIDVQSLFRLRDLLVDQFIQAHPEPPTQITLDMDPFDDPTHGAQQLTFFHGYYDQYQPRLITCAENDLVVGVCLLYGSAHPALGADDDLEYLVNRLRAVWPSVKIFLRADSGFGVPSMFDACGRLDVFYSIGLRMNTWLKRQSDFLLEEALERYQATGESQRLFSAFWYRADSWPAQRWVIVKCEANSQGTNRRAIVTDRPGAYVLPDVAYDGFVDRGESENRNKELKRGLQADRLSDHRYLANLFRLYLHTLSYNLLVHFRNLIVDPPGESEDAHPPAESLSGPERRAYHNRRRLHDPLGEGQPCTWRTRLIKVGAMVLESTRRVVVQLSSNWPYLDHYQQVSEEAVGWTAPILDSS